MALAADAIESQEPVGPGVDDADIQRTIYATQVLLTPHVFVPDDELHGGLLDQILYPQTIYAVDYVRNINEQFVYPWVNWAGRLRS